MKPAPPAVVFSCLWHCVQHFGKDDSAFSAASCQCAKSHGGPCRRTGSAWASSCRQTEVGILSGCRGTSMNLSNDSHLLLCSSGVLLLSARSNEKYMRGRPAEQWKVAGRSSTPAASRTFQVAFQVSWSGLRRPRNAAQSPSKMPDSQPKPPSLARPNGVPGARGVSGISEG
ncbi:hypothetical protein B0T22DRAFT_69567 [Podospora appendiculata]|uniref:Uncharacterized protein n=1 Tax=Podospora appendiculata TaxID=314037 RepID=A0AAE0XJ64_9PEZI|nr:hypothetical protein B0T22DRAFT_69567 [Podospora appendiculata]